RQRRAIRPNHFLSRRRRRVRPASLHPPARNPRQGHAQRRLHRHRERQRLRLRRRCNFHRTALASQFPRRPEKYLSGFRSRRFLPFHPAGHRHHLHACDRSAQQDPLRTRSYPRSRKRQLGLSPEASRARSRHRRGEIWRPSHHSRLISRRQIALLQGRNRFRSTARKSTRCPSPRKQQRLRHLGLFLRRRPVLRLGHVLRRAHAEANRRTQRFPRREGKRHLASRCRASSRQQWQRLPHHGQWEI